MRTLRHAPRPRKRSIAAATLGALALVGSLLVATPAQAINDTGTGGVYVPASGRVLDTKVGTGGFTTPMEAGKYRTIKIAGTAGIPDDGTVGAVSLNATVSGTPSAGTLFGRPDADTSRTTMLIYNANAGEYVSNTAIVAVSAAGTIQVSTETAARLILDVQGYYTANTDGTAAGGFVPVAGKRIVDTRSGLGAPKALLAPGKSVDIQVTGANGVPAGASGAVVNLLPINSTASDGYLTPYATGTTRPDNALHYAPSVNTSIQAQVRLSSSGKMTIYNGSSTINLVIDLQGYFTKAGVNGATFTPGIGRVFDSRATGNTILAKNETRAIQVAGQAGVPAMGSGITAVVLTLTVAHGGSDGRASVWANGTTQPETTSINFQADEIRTNTVTVALGANGKINLNNVADATNYVIDVQGWYTNPQAPTVTCNAPFANGTWVDATTDEDGALPSASCTVTAPPASRTGDQVEFDVNGAEQERFDLSATAASINIVVFDAEPGINLLEAYIISSDDVEGPRTTAAFGTGNWASASLVPLVDDSSTSLNNVVLGANPETGDGLPEDVNFKFWVHDDTAATDVVATDWQTELLPLDENTLRPGHSYSWNMLIRGTSRWSDVVTRTSPTWHFTTTDAATEAQYDPSVNDTTGQTFTKPTPDSILDIANSEVSKPYIEDSDEGTDRVSTRGLQFGPCWLETSGTWLRKSSGYNSVGTKPSTHCTKKVAKINMSSHAVRLKFALGFIPAGVKEYWPAQSHTAYNTSKFTDKKVAFECLNQSKSGTWYVSTLGHVLTNNRLNFYVWNHSKTKPLGCSEV